MADPKHEALDCESLGGPRRGEYLFAPGTVLQAKKIYDEVKHQPYRSEGQPVSPGLYAWFLTAPGDPMIAAWVDWLPDGYQRRIFGLAIWQWLGVLIGTVVGFGFMYIAYRIGGTRSESVRERSLLKYWGSMSFPIVAMLVPLAFKHFAYRQLTLRGTPLYVAEFSANLVFLMALIVVIMGLSSRLADSVAALPKFRSREVDPTLIRIIFRVLGIAAAAIVFLEGGMYLGFPLTTLLASAGLGGLALAFSAQGMLKGLFGTVTILLDRPFRVGDRILAKGQDGFVEDIGLRSTKLREYHTGHLISIPNDQMADTEIENIGKRKCICRMTDLHIPIDTSRHKVEQAIKAIRTILENHEGMDPDQPPRVYFNEFNPDYAVQVLAVFYLTGIGGTTYVFAASLVLLEKSEGTLQALRTTPLTSTAYITSKVITLTSFALIECAIVYFVAFFGAALNPAPMICGVVCLGVICTLVGLGQVASHDSVTGFLFPGAMLATLIMELPMFYVIAGPDPIWYLVPTHGSLLMMLGASATLGLWQWVYAVVVSVASILVAFWWAKHRFARLIGLQEG